MSDDNEIHLPGLNDEWANRVGPDEILPIVDLLAAELDLDDDQTRRVISALTSAFLRGVKAAVVEQAAQLSEHGIQTFLRLEIADPLDDDDADD